MAFDREQVIQDAMDLFWCAGYGGAVIPDLLSATGLGRQSLYNAFQSKHRLFLEALDRYQRQCADAVQRLFAEAPSPLAGIETLLLSIASAEGEMRARGCLSTNTIAEMGTSDGDVAEILFKGTRRFKDDLRAAMASAQVKGELSANADLAANVEFLITVARGLRLSGKAGASIQETQTAARMALAALRAVQSPDQTKVQR